MQSCTLEGRGFGPRDQGKGKIVNGAVGVAEEGDCIEQG